MLQLIAIAALCVIVLLQALELRKQKDRIENLEQTQRTLHTWANTPTTTHTRIPTRNPDDLT